MVLNKRMTYNLDIRYYRSDADYFYNNIFKDGFINKDNYFIDRLILMNSKRVEDFTEIFYPSFQIKKLI